MAKTRPIVYERDTPENNEANKLWALRQSPKNSNAYPVVNPKTATKGNSSLASQVSGTRQKN